MSTHATPSDPPDPARRRRNRGLLLVLLLAFFGALLLAGALRFSGWRPEGSKNRGELLEPYPDMRALVPQLADGRPYRWKDSPRTWRIVVMPGDCGCAARACCVYAPCWTRTATRWPARCSRTLACVPRS